MGLDIRVYQGLKLQPELQYVDEDRFSGYVNKNTAERVASWDDNKFTHYIGYNDSGFSARCPEFVDQNAVYSFEAQMGFRAGSYSGYGAWRHNLAIVGGHEGSHGVWEQPETPGPFVEMINFSDCDGTLGPAVSAKLYQDFCDFEEKAREHWGADSWEFEKYLNFKKAFEMAKDNGAVIYT